MRTRPTRRALTALLTATALLTGPVLAAVPAQAAPPRIDAGSPLLPAVGAGSARVPALGATATADRTAPAQGRKKARPQSELPPTAAPDRGSAKGAQSRALAAASCTPADFGSRTGATLVTFVKASTTDCVNTLFSVPQANANAVFREAQMVTVANAFRDNAVTYNGTNTTGTLQLVLFLRAGYYVQEQYPGTVGSYGTALASATRAGLDAFFVNSHLLDVSDANGNTLSETLILVDSAQEQARYLSAVKRVLNGYTSSWDAYYYMKKSVNDTYIPLFRGHYRPEFVAAVTADPSVIDTLNTFVQGHLNLLGTDRGYLVSNGGRELTRFAQHPALQTKVRPLARGLLTASAITGPRAALWVGVASMADYFDRAQCSYYGICDLVNKLVAAALPITHSCDPGHTIRAQSMTAAELAATCTSVRNQDAYFHGVVADPGPVANDRNTNIQINVFDSSADYGIYAGAIFDIDTNNGGMYLEGDPSVVGNQPRFIAYEAEWLRPVFAIWNLNHEYTHYLDGRYDMYGDFEAGQVVPDIWWIEGFAEYISYGYRRVDYTAAITEAGTHRYALSTLFQTTYANSNTTRTYNWGYLATRYMLEKHRPDVLAVLAKFRTGDYAGAYAYYNTGIGTRYDADFHTWLTACAAGACAGGAQNVPPTAAFDAVVTGLGVALTDRSVDSDGTVASRSWTFGDGTSSTATNPAKTYAAAGTYTVTLTVTDNQGATGSTSRAVTVTSGGGAECTASDVRNLGKNCQRSNRGAVTGGYDHLFLLLPAGVTQLRITTSGGTGDCDLLYHPTTWATNANATHRSTGPTNAETLTIANPPAGWNYVSLYGYGTCAGVTVKTEY